MSSAPRRISSPVVQGTGKHTGFFMATQRPLRRGFSGITVTTNDLRTIAHWGGEVGTLDIHANGARLMGIDQVDQVIVEDVVLERFEMVVLDTTTDERLVLSYDQSSVVVQCDEPGQRLRPAFDVICELLSSHAKNGVGRCLIDVSPPASWQAPATPPRLRAAIANSTPAATNPTPPTTKSASAGSQPGPSVTTSWWRRLRLPFGSSGRKTR
jgi:hypothetical protein